MVLAGSWSKEGCSTALEFKVKSWQAKDPVANERSIHDCALRRVCAFLLKMCKKVYKPEVP